MKTIILNGKKIKVPTRIESGLNILASNHYIAKRSDLWYGPNKHKKCYFNFAYDEGDIFGYKLVSKRSECLSRKAIKFFKDDHRCEYVVVANKRRVNAILAKL